VHPDYYADSRALGADLRRADYPEWADKIDDVITAGFTSGEILMGLRRTLRQIRDTERGLPQDLGERVQALYRAIDAVLL